MPTKRITELAELTTPADDDVFPVEDVDADETKKITLANIRAALAALTNGSFAGSHTGELRRTGAGTYAVARHELAASGAPTTGDDSEDGFSVGSLWFFISGDPAAGIYVCYDATAGAAQWVRFYPVVIADATTSASGLMTAADKRKVLGDVVGLSSGNHQLTPADRVIYCQPTALVQIDILGSDFANHEHDVLIHLHAGYGGQSIVLNPQGGATIQGAGVAYPLPDCESALAQAWRIYRTGSGDWRVVPLVVTYGTAAGTACEGNDGRLSDARAPTSHASTHAGDGADAIDTATTSVAGLMSAADKAKLDGGIAPVDDANTTIDTDSYAHGASVYTTSGSAVGVTANDAAAGKVLRFVQGAGGQITISAGSGVTLRYAEAFVAKSAQQWSPVVLEWRTATEVHVSGDLEAA